MNQTVPFSALSARLIKRGAEADIYLTNWAGRKAISKIRTPKQYRHAVLDASIRKQRTVHEASFISAAKMAGAPSPYVYFVDPVRAEIVMQFIEGKNVRDAITADVCQKMGIYAAKLHASNIIHGDLTTSNFIVKGRKLVLLDFGLAYYSERIEDRATDIRLVKEVFSSAHVNIRKAFEHFVEGYADAAGKRKTDRILGNVREIEQRGRYARVV